MMPSLLPTMAADSIFLAPPWGGPEYALRPRFTVDCFTPNGEAIREAASRPDTALVMQVPRTFDLGEFARLGRSG